MNVDVSIFSELTQVGENKNFLMLIVDKVDLLSTWYIWCIEIQKNAQMSKRLRLV